MVSFGNLRISLHKTLWCCLFLSESNNFENSCVNLYQFDFISIGNTENHFWAAPSKVVCINAVCRCIQFRCSGVLCNIRPNTTQRRSVGKVPINDWQASVTLILLAFHRLDLAS